MRRFKMWNGLWALLLAVPFFVGAGVPALGPGAAHAADGELGIAYDFDGGVGGGGGNAGYGDPDDPQGPQRPLMARPLSRGTVAAGGSWSRQTLVAGRADGPVWIQVRTVILSLRFYFLRY